MKLSDRLQMMADQICKGETMADIGTDHGFLPIYLLENRISNKVILTDISNDSLQKSIDNFNTIKLDKELLSDGTCSFDFRCGNGLEILEKGEVDAVVIAGMGGILISDILAKDIVKTRSFKKLILQPRNGQAKLRCWLHDNSFLTEKELLVIEGKFICEIIVASPSESEDEKNAKCDGDSQAIQYEIPYRLVKDNSRLGLDFVKRKLKIEKEILNKIIEGGSLDKDKIIYTKERIAYLEELLKG